MRHYPSTAVLIQSFGIMLGTATIVLSLMALQHDSLWNDHVSDYFRMKQDELLAEYKKSTPKPRPRQIMSQYDKNAKNETQVIYNEMIEILELQGFNFKIFKFEEQSKEQHAAFMNKKLSSYLYRDRFYEPFFIILISGSTLTAIIHLFIVEYSRKFARDRKLTALLLGFSTYFLFFSCYLIGMSVQQYNYHVNSLVDLSTSVHRDEMKDFTILWPLSVEDFKYCMYWGNETFEPQPEVRDILEKYHACQKFDIKFICIGLALLQGILFGCAIIGHSTYLNMSTINSWIPEEVCDELNAHLEEESFRIRIKDEVFLQRIRSFMPGQNQNPTP